MKEGILIYGCYGYTGKLITEHAVENGLKPTLAGRDRIRTEQLAKKYNLPFVVFDLKDELRVTDIISHFKVLLHCAGPFKFTAKVMMNSCLKARTHYLDITGEYEVFEEMFSSDEEAKHQGVLLMSGAGFDVVPSDCLAVHLKERLPDAEHLEMALLQRGGAISHGTAITVAENMGAGCMVRRHGKLLNILAGELTRVIDYGDAKRKATAIPWGDISTAYRSTGIPNITIYNHLPDKVIRAMKLSNYLGFLLNSRFFKNRAVKKIKKRPEGPTSEMRKKASGTIWGEVRNSAGIARHALLQLPEGYTLTAWTAVKIAQSILTKEPPHGAKSPAQVFGKDFILQFAGVNRTDVD